MTMSKRFNGKIAIVTGGASGIGAAFARRLHGEGAAVMIADMDDASGALFLSVVTVAEIEDGIAKARREGATRKAADLAGSLDALVHLHGSRILAIGPAVSRTAGKLSDATRGRGHAPGFADILIAATDGFTATSVTGDLLLGMAKNRGVRGLVTDGTLLKIYAWYDNEMGYACRMVDLACHMAEAGI